jgi:hypothetical protein
MRRAVVALSLGPAVLIGSATGADAQMVSLPAVCGEHESMVEKLANDYGESRRSVGLAATGEVVELFASATGSWSVVFTNVSGVSCLIMSGENWEQFEAAKITGPAV